MEESIHTVLLSRAQFAYTALFHILWPVLIVGLSIFLLILEALWLKTRKDFYYHQARFWTRIFLLNLAVGVVTGIPLEFQFGTNWSIFSKAGGDIFGHMLGFEATIAFMLEATFLSIMVYGWERVRRGMHLFSTAMVALGASLSVFWIMDANAWMQTPSGGYYQAGKYHVISNMQAVFNPNMPWAFMHKEAACLMITTFVVGGVSAWYLLRNQHADFFLKSFKMALIGALILTPAQIYLGDGSGRNVFEHQPSKLAAMEAHWKTNPPGEGAAWHIVAWPAPLEGKNSFEISIPYGLSLITTRKPTGTVKGLNDIPKEDQPPIWLPFYGFRIMLLVGFGAFFLMLYTGWVWLKGRLRVDQVNAQRNLLYAWIIMAPLTYLAMEAGWVTREVGRQPWVIYGLQRTRQAASPVHESMVGSSLALFVAIYSLLFVLFIFSGIHILRKGPTLKVPKH